VSVFGTRFVWYGEGARDGGGGGDGTHEDHVVKGALVHEMKAGFVAVEEGEAGVGGGVGEGLGQAIQGVAGGLAGGIVLEEAGFDGPGAAQAPGSGGHFLDDTDLDTILGRETVEVLGGEGIEALAAFLLENDAAGEQAMAQGVAGRGELAFGCSGTARAEAVGTGGKDTSHRRHLSLYSTTRIRRGLGP